MEQAKWLTCHWTITKKEEIWNCFLTKYQHLVFEFKVLFFFFSDSFQTTDGKPSPGQEKSGVEYFLLSVACFDNSLGRSSEEFKLSIELIPQSFSNMLPETNSLREICGVHPFFSCRENIHFYLLSKSYSVSLGQRSLTKSISRFLTQHNGRVLAEWSKHCIANWLLDMF